MSLVRVWERELVRVYGVECWVMQVVGKVESSSVVWSVVLVEAGCSWQREGKRTSCSGLVGTAILKLV